MAPKKIAATALNSEFVERMKKPIRKVWGMVAPDVMRDAETMGERIDNDCAIECCIDADRLVYEARDTSANAMLDLMLDQHGYPKVLKYLSTHIRLV